jgi:predicted DNA-binding protein
MIIRRGDLDTKVSFRLPNEQVEQIMRMADRMDTTLSNALRRVVIKGLKVEEMSAE